MTLPQKVSSEGPQEEESNLMSWRAALRRPIDSDRLLKVQWNEKEKLYEKIFMNSISFFSSKLVEYLFINFLMEYI